MNKEFCLLNEKWIRVLNSENNIREVSLIEIFQDAHLYKGLAGEIVTQDAAIFRVLLAIAITVFYRYDAEGNEDNILDYDDPEEEILYRWSEYWQRGHFNEKVFRNYLEGYRERFYLFHPETPFWQVGDLKQGTDYETINLFGNIKESNNKKAMHHFHMTDGKYIRSMSYAESARWIIYNNAYSVNVKTKVDGENRATGVGRLGQLGLIMVDADNLFQLVMLNLCALRNGTHAWGSPKPIWETPVRKTPGKEISPPDNLPELYTIQSRRLRLKLEENVVVGFRSIGGDFYSAAINNITEPMSLLKQKEGDKGDKPIIVPKGIKKEIMAWREFPSLLTNVQKEKPGLIYWVEWLIEEGLLQTRSTITFQLIGLEYGDGMSYTNGDLVQQELSISKDLLNKVGQEWVIIVTNQVQKCEQVVNTAYNIFAGKMSEIVYGKDADRKKISQIRDRLAEQYYFSVDKEFREWLLSIDPKSALRDEKEGEWERKSYRIANDIVEKYMAGVSSQYILQAADAVNAFKKNLNKIYQGRRDGV